MRIEEDARLCDLGDEHFSATVVARKDGDKQGTYVAIRKGCVVLTMLVVGVYFDDPDDLHDLLQPKLDRLLEKQRGR